MNAIEFINVSKKFKKGEKFDSLRDFIPNLFRMSLRGAKRRSNLPASVIVKNEAPNVIARSEATKQSQAYPLNPNEFWAVQDVSFQLKKGEALGIIGPNGAGKSTILKMLSRIYKPTSGEIKINGKLSALLEVGAGFHPDLTGRENIYLSAAIIGMKKKEIEAKIDSIIDFSELKDFIDTPVKKYSSGMYVRLGFSIAVHMKPDILLLDEVLAVGDMSFQAKCTEKITEIIKCDTTIIFISHSLELVRRLCPKAILLKSGNVIFNGSTEKAIETYIRYNADRKLTTGIDLTKISSNSKIKISKVRLYDTNGNEKNEFTTGDFMKIEISFSAREKINKPTFSVGFFSNGQIIADHNSRFEGKDVESISGEGKIDLIIENLLLLPGFYEIGAYLSDEKALIIYDKLTVNLFVKEKKRTGEGMYYQPHRWE